MSQQIFTIGHSNYPEEVFLNLLNIFNIETLADVRRFPGSKKHPHFNKDNLQKSLSEKHIRYIHIPELGGRRKHRENSENTGLYNLSFRGYADFMKEEEFLRGIDLLIKESLSNNTAIMCSEAVWWSCHRSLIADYLKSKGYSVKHIMNRSKLVEHPYTPAAIVKNGILSYPSKDLGF